MTRRLGHLLQPYAGRLMLVLLMMLVLTGINVARPWLMGLLFDNVLIGREWTVLWLVLAGFVAMYIGRNLLYFQGKYTSVRVGENIAFELRKRLFERLQQMSVRYYKQTGAGQISSRVMSDSFIIQTFIQDELPTLLQSALMVLCLIAALFWQDGVLALVATMVLPLHLLTARWFREPIRHSSRQAQQQIGEVHGNLIEKFFGVEVVKSFGGEQRETEAFNSAIDLSRRWQLRSHRYHVWQKVVADLLVGMGTVALIGLGAARVVWGHMQPGQFFAFFGWVMMLYPEILSLMAGFAKLTKSSASMERVFELLETGEGERSATRPYRDRVVGHIVFEDVHFAYNDDNPVLRGVNFEVPAGTLCAICGKSGGGKSTLVNLLPRFHDPDRGRVLIDEIDVRDYDLDHLRSAISISFQETFLFNSTVMENLRYARPDATDEDIYAAAIKTRAHDFILQLPQGYRTVLGGTGVILSRGEAQRIALCRAILKNSQILILDEATASLDAPTQRQIIPEIRQFARGKTTLMVTHNEELIAQADMIIRLTDGRVSYQGPPQSQGEWEHDAPPAPIRIAPYGTNLRRLPLWLAAAMLAGMVAFAATPLHAEPAPPAAEAPPAAPRSDITVRVLPQPGLNDIEVSELIDLAADHATAALGYKKTDQALADLLPPAPPDLLGRVNLARRSDQSLQLIFIGYRLFRSQPPHIYLIGQSFADPDAEHPTPGANPDVDRIVEQLTEGAKTLEQQYQSLNVGNLVARNITLSYIEVDRCLALLKSLGYQVIEYRASQGVGKHSIIDPVKQVDISNLPVIVEVPAPATVDLVGENAKNLAGQFGLQITPSIATSLPGNTASGPTLDIMVLYHPARPEQFSAVLDRIRSTLDVPARQILIEAMVLEITETGLKDLGVEWDLETPADNHELSNIDTLTLGRLPALAIGESTLDFEASNVFGEFSIRLRALVQSGQAEILSRPSVLTLDNRQASIRVGEEVPVATSAAGVRGGDRVEFNFKYIPIGILLNVRPRIDAEAQEVSMQIDGIVSAVVANEDLILRDQDGTELARAPRISTRRVQTYSRIANNTPFIIGGLISRDDTSETQKVPLLGDIPILGRAFRREKTDRLKREVIIVITPFVLPDQRVPGRNIPKDDDAFDSFDNKLFRDAYRIRADDVFDLAFITENPRLRRFKRLADKVVRQDFRLADHYPFNRFIGRSIPGESILVFRQMYEVIKRLQLDDQVDNDRLIYFESNDESATGFNVSFLGKTLLKGLDPRAKDRYQRGGLFDRKYLDPRAYFVQMPGKAMAITYTLSREAGVSEVLEQPIPEVRMIDCPDRDTWGKLLWELNQRDSEGRRQHTILLHDPSDLDRLRRAVLLKRVVQLNANRQSLTLSNFAIGRQLLMPSIKPGKIFLLDSQVARLFFCTEHYYAALEQELTSDIAALTRTLERPEMQRYLDDGDLERLPSP